MSYNWWIVTVPETDWNPSLSDGIVYCKGQLEQGETTEYRHWQVVFNTKKKVRPQQAKRLFGCETAHIEKTRSAAALEYVWKQETRVEGTQFELGKKPMKRNSPTDWDTVRENAKKGKLEDIPSDVYVRCYNQLKRIETDHREIGEDEVKRVIVYYGDTGVGKSRLAHKEAREAEGGLYKKIPNTKWWCGYRSQENIIIDEFFGDKTISLQNLLIWLDEYACTVETKGGSVPFAGKRIWITSNLHPSEWYPDAREEHKKALLRRLSIYKLTRVGLATIKHAE